MRFLLFLFLLLLFLRLTVRLSIEVLLFLATIILSNRSFRLILVYPLVIDWTSGYVLPVYFDVSTDVKLLHFKENSSPTIRRRIHHILPIEP